MPFDFNAVVHKQYDTLPVPPAFIPSTGVPEPHILWVGCSDSLIVETETLDVLPQEIFVHRNLGNILSNGDLSSASAVAWSVDLLKVDNIIVCGHYECALLKEEDPTALHGWSKDIAKLHILNEKLASNEFADEGTREHRLEEVYVLAETEWLRKQPSVKTAIRDRGLQIHAFVYDKERNKCVRLVEKSQGGNGKI